MMKPILKKVLEEYDKCPTSKKYNTIVKSCKELALEICELVHDTDFAVEYEVDGIANMCGLEIRIARELFSEERRRSIPPYLLDYYFSKKVKRELIYPKILLSNWNRHIKDSRI